MVITPFFVVIGSVFAKSLWAFRLFGAIICAATLSLSYLVCKENNCNSLVSYCVVILNSILIIFIPYANYNILLLTFMLASYIFVGRFLKKRDELSGFVAGFGLAIMFLIKQNIPTILILILSVLIIYLTRKKLMSRKSLISYIIGGSIPLLLFVIYLTISNSFYDFINYAVLGMTSFASNSIIQPEAICLISLSVLQSLLLIIWWAKLKEDRTYKFYVLAFSFSAYLFVFPLADIYHSIVLLIFQISISTVIIENGHIKSKYFKTIGVIAIMSLTLCFAIIFTLRLFDHEKLTRTELEPYQFINMTASREKDIKEISEFIILQENAGKDVAIIDGSAYLYNLAAGDYNGTLDMLNFGNLGTTSEESIISMINEKDIILFNKKGNWLDIEVFKDYVMENYIESGKVGDKTIYYKP